MAQVTDLLGRTQEIKGSVDEVAKLLRDALSAKTGKPTIVGEPGQKENEERNKKLENIEKTLENIDEKFKQSIDQAKNYAEEIVSHFKETGGKGGGSRARSGGGNVDVTSALSRAMKQKASPAKGGKLKIESPIQSIARDIKNLVKIERMTAKYIKGIHKAGTTKGSLETHDRHLESVVKKGSSAVGTGTVAGAAGGGAGGAFAGMAAAAGGAGRDSGIMFHETFNKTLMSRLTGVAGLISMMTGGFSLMQTMFQGAVQDELDFMINMRQIAFQVHGITGSTRELQEEFQEVGKVVAQTGHNLTAFQRQYVKNLKTGLKDRKAGISLTKSELNLSTMIGASVEETSGLFSKWHMQLGMNENQIAQVSREIQDVAKYTGITGDNLAKVVKDSEQFMKNMRDAGTLTEGAAGNVIGLLANAQKLGVEDQMKRLIEGGSSTVDLFKNANDQTKNLLFRIGALTDRTQDIRFGTIFQTRGGIKDMAKGLERVVEQYGVAMEDIPFLDPQTKGQINLAMEGAFGMELDEATRMFDTLDLMGKSFGERMSDLTKKMDNSNVTAQERLHYEEQMRDLTIGTGLKFATEFDKVLEDGSIKSFAGAMSKLEQSPKWTDDMRQDIKEMGADMLDPTEKMRAVLTMTAENIKEAGGADLTPKIEEAIASGDIVKMRETISELNQEQQKAGVKAAKGTNFVEQSAQTLNELNETVRSYTRPALLMFSAIAGAVTGQTLILAGIAAQLGAAYAGSKLFGGALSKLGTRLIGPAGGAATGAASTAATAGAARAAGGTLGPMMAGGAMGRGGTSAGGAAAGVGRGGFQMPDLKSALDPAKLKSAGGTLLKAAPALAMLTAGAMAAAGAILLTSKAIMAVTGIDAAEAAKVGLNVGGIILSAGAIAAAAFGASKTLEFIGKNISTLLKGAPYMLAGGAALAVMAPAITALAVGVIKLSEWATFGMDSGKAAKAAENISSIIWSAGKIALGVITASAALAAMGAGLMLLSGPQMLIAAAAMAAGAVGLGILTPVIMALSSAVIGMTEGFTSAVDPSKAAKTASDFATVLKAAGSIAWGVVTSAAALTALGLMMPLVPTMIPLMGMGAVSLAMLAGPTVALTGAILAMTEGFNAGVNADKAASTAEAFARVLKAGGDIAWGVIKSSASLAVMGAMFPLAPIMAATMWLGAATFAMFAPPVGAFMAGIIGFGKAMKSIVKPEEAQEVVAAMNSINEITKSVTGAINTLKDEIMPLVEGWGFMGWFGDSPLENLVEVIPEFKKQFTSIAKFIREGLIVPIFENFPNPELLGQAMKRVEGVIQIISVVPRFLKHLQSKIEPLVSGDVLEDTNIAGITANVAVFATFFRRIAEFLRFGIIDPIMMNFPDPQMLEEAMGRITTMQAIMGKASGMTMGGFVPQMAPAEGPGVMSQMFAAGGPGMMMGGMPSISAGAIAGGMVKGFKGKEKEEAISKMMQKKGSAPYQTVNRWADELSGGYTELTEDLFASREIAKAEMDAAKLMEEAFLDAKKTEALVANEMEKVNKSTDGIIKSMYEGVKGFATSIGGAAAGIGGKIAGWFGFGEDTEEEKQRKAAEDAAEKARNDHQRVAQKKAEAVADEGRKEAVKKNLSFQERLAQKQIETAKQITDPKQRIEYLERHLDEAKLMRETKDQGVVSLQRALNRGRPGVTEDDVQEARAAEAAVRGRQAALEKQLGKEKKLLQLQEAAAKARAEKEKQDYIAERSAHKGITGARGVRQAKIAGEMTRDEAIKTFGYRSEGMDALRSKHADKSFEALQQAVTGKKRSTPLPTAIPKGSHFGYNSDYVPPSKRKIEPRLGVPSRLRLMAPGLYQEHRGVSLPTGTPERLQTKPPIPATKPMLPSAYRKIPTSYKKTVSSGYMQTVGPLGEQQGLTPGVGEARSTTRQMGDIRSASLMDVHQRMQQERAGTEGKREISSPELVNIAGSSEQQVALLNNLIEGQNELIKVLKPDSKSAGEARRQAEASTRANVKPHNSRDYGTWQFGRNSQNASQQIISDGVN